MNQNRRSLPPPAATNHVVGNVGTSSGDGRSKTLAKSRSARPQSRNTAMLAMATASALLVVHASASKCIDDASYVSPMSLPCSAYAQLDCDGFRHVGWTDSEADELMKKCPSSCRAPHCDNIGTVISQGRSLMHGKVAETEVKWTQGRGGPIQSQVKYRMDTTRGVSVALPVAIAPILISFHHLIARRSGDGAATIPTIIPTSDSTARLMPTWIAPCSRRLASPSIRCTASSPPVPVAVRLSAAHGQCLPPVLPRNRRRYRIVQLAVRPVVHRRSLAQHRLLDRR